MRSRRTIEMNRNTKPNPECLLQNQFLILETNLDIRDQLSDILVKINKVGSPEINLVTDSKDEDTKAGEVL